MGLNATGSKPIPVSTDELSFSDRRALIVTEKAKTQVGLERELYAFYWQTQEKMKTEAAAIAAQAAQTSSASSVSTQSAQFMKNKSAEKEIIEDEKKRTDGTEIENSTQAAEIQFSRAESFQADDSEDTDTDSDTSTDTTSPRPRRSSAWKWSLGTTAISAAVTFGVIAAVFILSPVVAPFLPFFLAGLGALFGALTFAGIVAGGVLLIGGIVTLALACKKNAPEKVSKNELTEVALNTQFGALHDVEDSSVEKLNAPPGPLDPSAAPQRGSTVEFQAVKEQKMEPNRSFSS